MADNDLVQPLAGDINRLRRQGPGADRVYRKGRHKGFDYTAAIGTQVYAIADGKVILTRNVWAFNDQQVAGIWVLIQHAPGIASAYMHLSSIQVKKGMIVKAGDPIALSGDTGGDRALKPEGKAKPMAPHLHFTMMTQEEGKRWEPNPALAIAWEKHLVIDPLMGGQPLPKAPVVPDEEMTTDELEQFEQARSRVQQWARDQEAGIPPVQPRRNFLQRRRPWSRDIRRPRATPPLFPKPFKPPVFPKPYIPPTIKTYTPPPIVRQPSYITKPYTSPFKTQPLPPRPPATKPFIYRPPVKPYQPPVNSRPWVSAYGYRNLDGNPRPGTPATNFKGTEIFKYKRYI